MHEADHGYGMQSTRKWSTQFKAICIQNSRDGHWEATCCGYIRRVLSLRESRFSGPEEGVLRSDMSPGEEDEVEPTSRIRGPAGNKGSSVAGKLSPTGRLKIDARGACVRSTRIQMYHRNYI